MAHGLGEGAGILFHGVPALLPCLVHRLEHLQERRPAGHRPGREVGAGMEREPVRCQENGHGPAALAADRLRGGHVGGVHVGPLFPVHLDGDEVRVQVVGRGLVLEAFMGHDVAPVAGGVADRQEHRNVPGGGTGKRPVAERLPMHRVARMLPEVRRGLLTQGVAVAGVRRRFCPHCLFCPRCRLCPYCLRCPQRASSWAMSAASAAAIRSSSTWAR